jgi:hypothetical protein
MDMARQHGCCWAFQAPICAHVPPPPTRSALPACRTYAELGDMRRKADTQQREEAQTAATMASIEAAAQRQYAADLAAAAELKKQTLGEWVSARRGGLLACSLPTARPLAPEVRLAWVAGCL